MQITRISVSSSRKLPYPNVDFGSVSGLVTLEADLGEADNTAACVQKLQAQADTLVDKHMAAIAERFRQRASERQTSKAQDATQTTAAALAAKHGGK